MQQLFWVARDYGFFWALTLSARLSHLHLLREQSYKHRMRWRPLAAKYVEARPLLPTQAAVKLPL
jgi:hypothetical protein